MQVRTGEIHLEGGKIQQVVLSYGQKTFAAKLTFAWKGGMQDDWTYDIRETFRPYFYDSEETAGSVAKVPWPWPGAVIDHEAGGRSGFVLPNGTTVTESARACCYFSSKQVQKTC